LITHSSPTRLSSDLPLVISISPINAARLETGSDSISSVSVCHHANPRPSSPGLRYPLMDSTNPPPQVVPTPGRASSSVGPGIDRSEEHTSELQSRFY